MEKPNLNILQRIKPSDRRSQHGQQVLTAFPSSPASPLGPGPPSTPYMKIPQKKSPNN